VTADTPAGAADSVESTVVNEGQRPLELILARNLITGLSTPAFLVDEEAVVVFYNEAAGALLGRRFEESGRMPPEVWSTAFGPKSPGGEALTIEQLPLTQALRRGRPAHHRFRIHSLDEHEHEIEVSAIPIVTTEGTRGALAIFWPVDADEES
jgi:PAS domain-containing protein